MNNNNKEHIELLETKLRHLKNDFILTKEENEKAVRQYMDMIEERVTKALSGESQSFHWQYRRKNGELIDTVVRLTSLVTPDMPQSAYLLQAILREHPQTNEVLHNKQQNVK